MLARIMREHFGAKNPRSWMLRFHTQTAGSTLTAQQPENNIVRTTLQALAGVLGGTQSLHTNGFDEALALPTEQAARIALRTQQILAHESGVAQTVDPLAGSFYVESLTNEIERRAHEYMATIASFDEGGRYGMLRAIEQGYVQREIQNAAYAYQRAVDKKEAIVVGVNEFVNEEVAVPIQRIDEALEGRLVERVRALRRRRDAGIHAAALRSVEDAARSGANLVPHILNAVESYATVGEIANVMRTVFGEYRETVTV
jgi:methylmalonyl-CoA mutase N-terminal domain/subunit